MSLLSFLATIHRSKKSRSTHRHANRRRLFIEPLEDRNLPSTFSVLNLNDSGAGSLRRAIREANANPGADVIDFEVAGTIQLSSRALPAITDTLTLDGTSAPGFARKPVIEIDFNGFGGLRFNRGSHGSSLKSMGIVGAGSAGVTLNAANVTLLGNYIGVALDGTTAAGNKGDGVRINSSGNTIGGVHPLGRDILNGRNRNVISGNGGNGIGIYGSSRNAIIANFIGVDAKAEADLGNGRNGILLTRGASANVIGGRTALPDGPPIPDNYQGKPKDGNVISGNDRNGVLLTGGANHNELAGNFIGTDLTGNRDVGNALDGVAIVNHSHNNSLVGARFTFPGNEDAFVYYNVVSGNDRHGLRIHNSNNTTVHANFFGLGADNNTRVGNAVNGVLIAGSSTDTQFGGPIPLGNVTSANGRHGLEIRDTARGTLSFNTFAGTGAFNNSTRLGNQKDGIHITSTGGNTVLLTSVMSGNRDDGVEISGNARGVTIEQNLIGLAPNPPGFLPLANGDNGVEIGGNAHHNFVGGFHASSLQQNTISANGNNGVAIIGNAHHNQVLNSFIGTNVLGINFLGAAPLGNGNAGVYVGGNSHHNLIGGFRPGHGNLISGNQGHGIELAGQTRFNWIVANLIGSDSSGNAGIANAGAGVYLGRGTHHNALFGNTAIGNNSDGFSLYGSNHNLLIGNSAIANSGDGFHLDDSDFNTLIRNIATQNSGDGFHIVNSKHNRFIGNMAERNLGYGYFVDKVFANLFLKNECYANALGGSNLPGIC